MNNGVADKLSVGGLMQEPYVIAYQILHDMNNINRAWYTHKDQVYPLTYKLTKE